MVLDIEIKIFIYNLDGSYIKIVSHVVVIYIYIIVIDGIDFVILVWYSIIRYKL